MEFNDYLKILAHKDGSDLYLSANAPPCAKFNGTLKSLDKEPLSAESIKTVAYQLMDDEQRREFEQQLEMNLAIHKPNVERFRVNIFRQRNDISLVIRNIKTEIPHVEELGLPPVLTEIMMEKRGLVLFVGATGSGKSTLIRCINRLENHDAGTIAVD